jgi:hypothetical protein
MLLPIIGWSATCNNDDDDNSDVDDSDDDGGSGGDANKDMAVTPQLIDPRRSTRKQM